MINWNKLTDKEKKKLTKITKKFLEVCNEMHFLQDETNIHGNLDVE